MIVYIYAYVDFSSDSMFQKEISGKRLKYDPFFIKKSTTRKLQFW